MQRLEQQPQPNLALNRWVERARQSAGYRKGQLRSSYTGVTNSRQPDVQPQPILSRLGAQWWFKDCGAEEAMRWESSLRRQLVVDTQENRPPW